MRRNGRYMLCTIDGLAEYLAATISVEGTLGNAVWKFADADFGLLEGDEPDLDGTLDFESLSNRVDSWFGIKKMPPLGFDCDMLELACDYYGGGHLSTALIEPDYLREMMALCIAHAIRGAMGFEVINSLLLVDLKPDERR